MPPPFSHIFGPVPSRRLGQSLGVDIIPSKLCTLDCVYCEVGATDKRGLARREYYPVEKIVAEVGEAIRLYPHLDHITISGSGEPTLHSGLGRIIRGIKMLTEVPVAVLTNGTLMTDAEVRRDLVEADIVSPSLDAASQEVFNAVDRPHPDLRIEKIIDGLAAFRSEFAGQIWLEILFVRGMNDSNEEVLRLKQAIERISPDRIQLNTVVRPPAEPTALPVTERRLKEICALLGGNCEVIGVYHEKTVTAEQHVDAERVVALLRRRGMRLEEMADALEMHRADVAHLLTEFVAHGTVVKQVYEGETFYQARATE